jgi:hypothetical protein
VAIGDLEQTRLAALGEANAVRVARAQLKREIASGSVAVADVLIDPPAIAASWRVAALLMSQRGWGRVKCARFLADNRIGDGKRIGELTVRQRGLLADQLRRPRPAPPATSEPSGTNADDRLPVESLGRV